MIDYISQEELAALSDGELRFRLTQLFNALAAQRKVFAQHASQLETASKIRAELRRRRFTP